jgi:hypothetical protein
MSLFKRFRSSPYRIRAAGHAILGVFLAFVVMNDASLGLYMRVLSLGVALVAIIGGLKRALRSR